MARKGRRFYFLCIGGIGVWESRVYRRFVGRRVYGHAEPDLWELDDGEDIRWYTLSQTGENTYRIVSITTEELASFIRLPYDGKGV